MELNSDVLLVVIIIILTITIICLWPKEDKEDKKDKKDKKNKKRNNLYAALKSMLFGASFATSSVFSKSAESTPAPILIYDNEPDIVDG